MLAAAVAVFVPGAHFFPGPLTDRFALVVVVVPSLFASFSLLRSEMLDLTLAITHRVFAPEPPVVPLLKHRFAIHAHDFLPAI